MGEPPSARQQPSTSTPPSLPSSCSPGLPSDLPWCPVASWAPENWPQHQLLLREISSTSLPDRPIERGPVKALIFPAEWFDALYPKTGVTGPYMALFGVSTFLASKEYFVMEHDFYVGIGLAIVLTYLIKTQGPAYTADLNKQLDEEESALRAIRQDEIDACLANIAGEQGVQDQATAWADIIAAKKEADGLQLEGEYRSRLSAAHAAVKKRLDYQVETANVLRRMEQKH